MKIPINVGLFALNGTYTQESAFQRPVWDAVGLVPTGRLASVCVLRPFDIPIRWIVRKFTGRAIPGYK